MLEMLGVTGTTSGRLFKGHKIHKWRLTQEEKRVRTIFQRKGLELPLRRNSVSVDRLIREGGGYLKPLRHLVTYSLPRSWNLRCSEGTFLVANFEQSHSQVLYVLRFFRLLCL